MAMASRLLKTQVELKFGRKASPSPQRGELFSDTASVSSQNSVTSRISYAHRSTDFCERRSKAKTVGVTFCSNNGVPVHEMRAKILRPRQKPKTPKVHVKEAQVIGRKPSAFEMRLKPFTVIEQDKESKIAAPRSGNRKRKMRSSLGNNEVLLLREQKLPALSRLLPFQNPKRKQPDTFTGENMVKRLKLLTHTSLDPLPSNTNSEELNLSENSQHGELDVPVLPTPQRLASLADDAMPKPKVVLCDNYVLQHAMELENEQSVLAASDKLVNPAVEQLQGISPKATGQNGNICYIGSCYLADVEETDVSPEKAPQRSDRNIPQEQQSSQMENIEANISKQDTINDEKLSTGIETVNESEPYCKMKDVDEEKTSSEIEVVEEALSSLIEAVERGDPSTHMMNVGKAKSSNQAEILQGEELSSLFEVDKDKESDPSTQLKNAEEEKTSYQIEIVQMEKQSNLIEVRKEESRAAQIGNTEELEPDIDMKANAEDKPSTHAETLMENEPSTQLELEPYIDVKADAEDKPSTHAETVMENEPSTQMEVAVNKIPSCQILDVQENDPTTKNEILENEKLPDHIQNLMDEKASSQLEDHSEILSSSVGNTGETPVTASELDEQKIKPSSPMKNVGQLSNQIGTIDVVDATLDASADVYFNDSDVLQAPGHSPVSQQCSDPNSMVESILSVDDQAAMISDNRQDFSLETSDACSINVLEGNVPRLSHLIRATYPAVGKASGEILCNSDQQENLSNNNNANDYSGRSNLVIKNSDNMFANIEADDENGFKFEKISSDDEDLPIPSTSIDFDANDEDQIAVEIIQQQMLEHQMNEQHSTVAEAVDDIAELQVAEEEVILRIIKLLLEDCVQEILDTESSDHDHETTSASSSSISGNQSDELENSAQTIQNTKTRSTWDGDQFPSPDTPGETFSDSPVPGTDILDTEDLTKSVAGNGQLKKLVPEVCACDTTTSFTDDELGGSLHLSSPTVNVPTLQTSPNTVAIPETKPPHISERGEMIKMGRREWAKELTKIRIRLREKKAIALQNRMQQAKFVRKKAMEAKRKVSSISKMERENAPGSINCDLHPPLVPEKVQPAPIIEEMVQSATNYDQSKYNDPLEQCEIKIGDCSHVSQESTSLPIFSDVSLSNESDSPLGISNIPDRIPSPQESLKMGALPTFDIEPIEVVDDDDDDEGDDEPWPFPYSPASDADVEHGTPTVAGLAPLSTPNQTGCQKTPAANEMDSPKTPENHDEKSLDNAEHLFKVPDSVQTTIVEKHNDVELQPVLGNQLAKVASDHETDKDKSHGDGKPKDKLHGDGKPTVTAMKQLVIDDSSTDDGSITDKASTVSGDSEHDFLKETDPSQPARMQSRSTEGARTNPLTDNMWKDMFNSVAPLSFDEPDSAKKRKFAGIKLLPSVYLKSQSLIERIRVDGDITQEKTAKDVTFENTPSGVSYPIAESKVVPPVTASNLKLCSCKSDGSSSTTEDAGRSLYCQAIETIGKGVVNCLSRVTDKFDFRASGRLPRMALCKHHKKKLSQHSSCPVCGLFCSGGTFLDCTSGKGHLSHVSCQVKAADGTYLCPHCGEKSLQVKVILISKRKVELQRPKQAPKKESQEGIARMCIRLVTRPTTSSAAAVDDPSHANYDSKLFEVSKSKLLDGAEKTKLITIMCGLQHLVPVMREKLTGTAGVTTLYDLSSYILKNDLSQLALGICDVMKACKDEGDKLRPLDKRFSEQGGKTLLHLAVQSSSLATVHCLVMAGVALNSTDFKGVSPLMMAAKGNQLDILKYLIGAGALIEWRDIDGMTPLHVAAVAGNKAICEYLLCNVHANIDCVDEGGWTPIVWAIENGHTNLVKMLLANDANIHKRDSEGNACIHWGAYSGNTEIIKLLITRGADIEAVNELGDRPLHIAVRQARTDAVILLLSHGVDTSAINNLHQTPAECCHGACSDNMRAFLTVNDVLRSCKLRDVVTRSSRLLHQDIARGKENVPIPVTNEVDDINYPSDFTYVTESVWTSPVPINTTISSLSRCHCSGDCTRSSCTCARSSIACWYDSSGVLATDFDFSNPPQIFECNKACGCWSTCANRVVQQGITVQLELFKTKHRGWGVRARHDIVKGSFVCEYVGELITDSNADEREDDSYLFDLDYKDGDTYCMDAKHYGNISRFINHRCEPNLTPVSVFIDHQDTRFPRICLFANTDIQPGTELGFDYGEKFWLVKYKHFLCDCGCPTCKYNETMIKETLAQYHASNPGKPADMPS